MDKFLTKQPSLHGSGEGTKTEAIDRDIMALAVGERVSYPIADKGTITARVSEINKMIIASGGEQAYRTQSDKVNFRLFVIRDK